MVGGERARCSCGEVIEWWDVGDGRGYWSVPGTLLNPDAEAAWQDYRPRRHCCEPAVLEPPGEGGTRDGERRPANGDGQDHLVRPVVAPAARGGNGQRPEPAPRAPAERNGQGAVGGPAAAGMSSRRRGTAGTGEGQL